MRNYFLTIAALVSCLFFASCNSDNDKEWTPGLTPEEVAKLPYSELTPDQQKVKLEKEASDFLDMASELKSQTMIDAYKNLNDLIKMSFPDLIGGEPARSAEDIFKYANVFGIHEWNPSTQEWVKTTSTSELKFIFPATASSKTNNATLVASATASDVIVNLGEVNVPLPTLVTGLLTIDGKESAKINLAAEYNNQKLVPSKIDFDVLYGNYNMEFDFSKAAENKLTLAMKYKDNMMLYAETGATIKIDDIIAGASEMEFGKVNSYIQLTDNLVFYADIDIDAYFKEKMTISEEYNQKQDALYSSRDETYYDKLNELNRVYSEQEAACTNKYVKFTLASIKDATKVATLKFVSEKEEEEHPYRKWDEVTQEWVSTNEPNMDINEAYYDENTYLVFNDNTEVEAKAFFSEGFDTIIEKWMNFIGSNK